MGSEPPAPGDLPDPGLVPVDDAAPLVDQPAGFRRGVGAVDLHLVVFGTPSTFLAAFTGNNENLCVLSQRVNIGVQLAFHLCF